MNDDDILCTCYDVTVKDIKEAVNNGATTLDEVQEATQAGTLCGACINDLEDLVNELVKK